MEQDLVFRLRKRAEIRRQISSRKSVQEGKPDRIADLLEEAASEIEMFRVMLVQAEFDEEESGCPCGQDGGTSCGAVGCLMLMQPGYGTNG